MKTTYLTIMTAALLLSAVCVQTCSAQGATSVGLKYRQMHSEFSALPYDDGDISLGIAYESHTPDSFWQLAVEYAWDASGIDSTEFIITPQLNILWKDGPWYGGFGVLTSYIDDKATGDDWLDAYWQALIGAKVPMLGSNADIGVTYEFEEWDNLNDFDIDDLQYAIWLNVAI